MPFDPAIKIQSSNNANPKADLSAQQFASLTKPTGQDKKTRLGVGLARIFHWAKTGTYYNDAKLEAALSTRVALLPPNAYELDTVQSLFDSFKVAGKGNHALLSQQINSKRIPWFLLNVQNTPHEFLAEYYTEASTDINALKKLVLLAVRSSNNDLLRDILTDFNFASKEEQSVLRTALKATISSASLEKAKLIVGKLDTIEISLVKLATTEQAYEIANFLISHINDGNLQNERREKLILGMIDSEASPRLIKSVVESFNQVPSYIKSRILDYYKVLIRNKDFQGAFDLLLTGVLDVASATRVNADELAKLIFMLAYAPRPSNAPQIYNEWLAFRENKARIDFPNAIEKLQKKGYYFPSDLTNSYPALFQYFETEYSDENALSELLLFNIGDLCGLDTAKCFEKALEKLGLNLKTDDPTIIEKLVVLEKAEDALIAAFTNNSIDIDDDNGKELLALVMGSTLSLDQKKDRILLLTKLGANPLEPSDYIQDFFKSIPDQNNAMKFIESLIQILDERIEIQGWATVDSKYRLYDDTANGMVIDAEDEKICRSAIRQAMLFELLGNEVKSDALFDKIIATKFSDENGVPYSKRKIITLALEKGYIELAKDYAVLASYYFTGALKVGYHFKEAAEYALNQRNLSLYNEIIDKLPIKAKFLLELLEKIPPHMEEYAEKIVFDPKFEGILRSKLGGSGFNILHIALSKGWNGITTFVDTKDPSLFGDRTLDGIYPVHFLLNPQNLPIWNNFRHLFDALQMTFDPIPDNARKDFLSFIRIWVKHLTNRTQLKFDVRTNHEYALLADQQAKYLGYCQELLDVNGDAKNEVVELFNNLNNNKLTPTQLDEFKKGINLSQFLSSSAKWQQIALLLMRMGSTDHFTINELNALPASKELVPFIALGGYKICGQPEDQEPFMLQVVKDMEAKILDLSDLKKDFFRFLSSISRYYPVEEINQGLHEEYSSKPALPKISACKILLKHSPEMLLNWDIKLTKDDTSELAWAEKNLSFDARKEYFSHRFDFNINPLIVEYQKIRFIGSIDRTHKDYQISLRKALEIAIKEGYVSILKDVMQYANLTPKKVMTIFIREGWDVDQMQKIIELLNETWQIKGSGGRGLLHTATAAGNIKVFQKLLDTGTKIQSLDSKSNTALVIAARYGQKEIVDLILSIAKKRSINLMSELSLKKAEQEATKNGYADIAETLHELIA